MHHCRCSSLAEDCKIWKWDHRYKLLTSKIYDEKKLSVNNMHACISSFQVCISFSKMFALLIIFWLYRTWRVKIKHLDRNTIKKHIYNSIHTIHKFTLSFNNFFTINEILDVGNSDIFSRNVCIRHKRMVLTGLTNPSPHNTINHI